MISLILAVAQNDDRVRAVILNGSRTNPNVAKDNLQDFDLNLGKSNRFLKRSVNPSMWEDILRTYPDADLMNIWKSLLLMTQLFHEMGVEVARALGYDYNLEEAKNVEAYIRLMRDRG